MDNMVGVVVYLSGCAPRGCKLAHGRFQARCTSGVLESDLCTPSPTCAHRMIPQRMKLDDFGMHQLLLMRAAAVRASKSDLAESAESSTTEGVNRRAVATLAITPPSVGLKVFEIAICQARDEKYNGGAARCSP